METKLFFHVGAKYYKYSIFFGFVSDICFWPFNSQMCLTSNFSLQYPYIIQQKWNENTQTYQVEVAILI